MTKDLDTMGITALREEAKRLDIEKENALDKALAPARKALKEAKDRYYDEQCEVSKRVNAQFAEQREAVAARIKAYEDAKKAKEVQVPEHIQELLRLVQRGVDYGHDPFRVMWVSDSGRFFILKYRGGSYWSGIGCTAYSSTKHLLMDCERADESRDPIQLWKSLVVEKDEGRLTKAVKESWIQKATEMEASE